MTPGLPCSELKKKPGDSTDAMATEYFDLSTYPKTHTQTDKHKQPKTLPHNLHMSWSLHWSLSSGPTWSCPQKIRIHLLSPSGSSEPRIPESWGACAEGAVEAVLYGPVRRPKFNPQKRRPNSDRYLRNTFSWSHAQTAKANATYQDWLHELKPRMIGKKEITYLYDSFLRTIYVHGVIYHDMFLKGIVMVDRLFNEELLQWVWPSCGLCSPGSDLCSCGVCSRNSRDALGYKGIAGGVLFLIRASWTQAHG